MPDLFFEKQLWKQGIELVAGSDEVGRGCVAGPLYAAAVAFPKNIEKKLSISKIKIDDSKKLTQKQRQESFKWIQEYSLGYGLGVAENSVIDKKGIVKSVNMAFRNCAISLNKMLNNRLEYLLIDAFNIRNLKGFPVGNGKLHGKGRQYAIVKGDEKSISIAAASIVAKVARDSYMRELSNNNEYSFYGWGSNKGYGTNSHNKAIQKYGITKYHRKTFLRKLLD